MRRCVACGTRRPQADLLRLFRTGDGTLALTADPHREGRGAYCCPTRACGERTIDKRLFGRTLRANAKVDDREALLTAMAARAANLQTANGVWTDGENNR